MCYPDIKENTAIYSTTTFYCIFLVTPERKQKYYSTGKELSVDDWEVLSSTKSKSLLEVRKDIQSSFEIVKEAIQDLCSEGGFSFDALNNRLNKGVSDALFIIRYKKAQNYLFD